MIIEANERLRVGNQLMDVLKDLLLNVLFIIVFLLFIPLFLEINKKQFFTKYKKWINLILPALAIVGCMSIPITLIEGRFYDLRWVAIIVGGLYGGPVTSLFLVLFAVIYRLTIGGAGATTFLIGATIMLPFIFFFAKVFFTLSKKKKYIVGTSLSFIAFLVTILNSVVFFHVAFDSSFVLLYSFLVTGTTFLVIYLFEMFRETIMINERVVKAEKLELVSHLASSISHEVRNPLAVVRGFMQMMIQMDLSEEKRKEYLKIAIEEIDRANDIIRNYLTFAKPSLENEVIMDVKQELLKTIKIITPFLNMNCIEIKTKIETCFYKSEPQLFQQCFLNIMKNCIEAMPESGKLLIETEIQNDDFIIMISDTGKGMTPEQISRLGEPYFTTKGREGTGLGMMVVYQIVEMMRGEISVSSKIDEGTKFIIRLPLDKEINEEIGSANVS